MRININKEPMTPTPQAPRSVSDALRNYNFYKNILNDRYNVMSNDYRKISNYGTMVITGTNNKSSY